MRRTPRPAPARIAIAALASAALLGLSACSGDSDSDTDASDRSSASAPAESPEADAGSEESADAAPAGDQPEWANPVTTPGTKLTTIKAGDISVDVYQVGTTKATKSGQFADPKTNKPLLAEGDEIVFVNYVATNNGDDIDLGSSGVAVEARYDDWPYIQGMDSIVDKALFEQQQVNDGAFAPGSFRDPSVYPFAAGQQISWGENFKYQKGSPITFEVRVIPVDEKGDLRHDDKVEAEGTATIS